MKIETCPKCTSTNIGDQWAKGHKLQQHCHDCGWKSEPRIPEIEPIRVTKEIQANCFPGFRYEIFDQYGHILISSRSYDTETDAKLALNKELKNGERDVDAGPYTAILWPATTIVRGKIYK